MESANKSHFMIVVTGIINVLIVLHKMPSLYWPLFKNWTKYPLIFKVSVYYTFNIIKINISLEVRSKSDNMTSFYDVKDTPVTNAGFSLVGGGPLPPFGENLENPPPKAKTTHGIGRKITLENNDYTAYCSRQKLNLGQLYGEPCNGGCCSALFPKWLYNEAQITKCFNFFRHGPLFVL